MSAHPMVVVEAGVSLALPAETPSTLSKEEGRPDVRRYFPGGPAVYAVSAVVTDLPPLDAVGLAAGDVVSLYRTHDGFLRTPRPAPDVEGAAEAILLDFVWQDSHGVLMHSVVLIVGVAGKTVVVHGAFPELHGAEVLREVETTVLSCRLGNEVIGKS